MKVVVEYWVGSVVATREHLKAYADEKVDGSLAIYLPPVYREVGGAIKDGGGPYGGYAKGVWRYYHYELDSDAPASGS